MSNTSEKILKLRIRRLFRDVNGYIISNPLFVLCVVIINIAYVLLFKFIPRGISNPLSILWIGGYYAFWCAFYRYYYNLKPYLFSKTIMSSLKPSTKAVFIMFAVMMLIAFLPMIPLLLGFDKLYLDFYEHYMHAIEGLSAIGKNPAPVWGIVVVYGILSLLSPLLICKPYLYFIAALRKQTGFVSKNKHRTDGNFWKFVAVSAILLFTEAFIVQIDKTYHLNDWFVYTADTFLFVYTNIVFAKMFDFFFIKN